MSYDYMESEMKYLIYKMTDEQHERQEPLLTLSSLQITYL